MQLYSRRQDEQKHDNVKRCEMPHRTVRTTSAMPEFARKRNDETRFSRTEGADKEPAENIPLVIAA